MDLKSQLNGDISSEAWGALSARRGTWTGGDHGEADAAGGRGGRAEEGTEEREEGGVWRWGSIKGNQAIGGSHGSLRMKGHFGGGEESTVCVGL